ncbi:NAD(P)H-hydrate dehydratase [Vibrio salinus]|uniref:NAD(P)H-hydrate dehydratase n=1 Tax=Vibrio salinus TaxID=2899784 RepID=UPI001E493955|nr:NAD(P)H-hydrate dehydratase [Vibrio salinus]MCE0495257.1 NAD(P)H-hydrate dehydratase [Vibrio salinus]
MVMPSRLYTAEQVRSGEKLAAKSKELRMYYLMERAGQAVFAIGMAHFPGTEHWLVCCGAGNNGGDGYIVANLAKSVGINVTVWQVGGVSKIKGDARIAYEHWICAGGQVVLPGEFIPDDVDMVIDGLLGTGLKGDVREETGKIINLINRSGLPVIAIDIPSGLCSDTGTVLGKAVKAAHTVTFIGAKQGLVTGFARDYVGQLHFAGLGVEDIFDELHIPSAWILDKELLTMHLGKRAPSSHKGSHGKGLIVGGGAGMAGALVLASTAALKTGIGMISTVSDPNTVLPVVISKPEVMASGWDDVNNIGKRLDWCNVVAIGPGLGRDSQAEVIYEMIRESELPKVVDADGLYFLARQPSYDAQRVITPHPGEAARLLGCSVSEVEKDRYHAVQDLQNKFGGIVVLKGAGTLVCDSEQCFVCCAGNPGMATAGMGDVLTGIITSFIAQGHSLLNATRLGVLVHSLAADEDAKEYGERGLVASDLFPHLRNLVN